VTELRCEIRLSHVLTESDVALGFAAEDPAEAAAKLLAGPLGREGLTGSRLGEALEAIRQRENAGSTIAGPVAIPHARLPGLSHIVAALGVNPNGVFPCDGGPTLVLAFASPSHTGLEHLKFLASAAQTFRNDALVGRILAATSPAEVLDALRATA
jgi:mannitol/fructose-specific phosphotransferase system IIA component (Ntr-type)